MFIVHVGINFAKNATKQKVSKNLSIASMGYAVYLCTLCMEESNIAEK